MTQNKHINTVEIGSRQLSLFDNENEISAEQELLETFVAASIKRQGRVNAHNLVEKARNHTGLAEDVVWQHLFWLAQDLVIHFRFQGETIKPSEARKRLLDPDQPDVTIVLNQPVDEAVYLHVKTLFGNLLGDMRIQATHDQVEFARGLVRIIRKCAATLEFCRSLAASHGFPGKNEIKTGLSLVKKLFEKLDAYSLINAFYKRSGKITRLLKTVETLGDFYTRHADLWRTLLEFSEASKNTLPECADDPRVVADLEAFNRILSSDQPYDLVAEANKLMKTLKPRHKAILAKQTNRYRKRAMSELDDIIDKMKAHLQTHTAPDELCNRALYPLRLQSKRILTAKKMEHIKHHMHTAQQSFETFWDIVQDQ